MATTTAIQWTDHTFNPWRGCTRVSPGCLHCYAETLSQRNPKVLGTWGPQGTRPLASAAYWRQPLAWNRQAKKQGRRQRVFCASLADVFEDRDDLAEPRQRLFELIEETTWLDWQLLTKRPENFARFLPWRCDPWPNVWLMVSVENQHYTEHRIPALLQVPARIRGLSAEPLLGPLNLCKVCGLDLRRNPDHTLAAGSIDWLIIGGESGPGARPCHVEWVRDLVNQCQAAGVPLFVKQLGSRPCLSAALDGWPEHVAFHKDQPATNLIQLRDPKGGAPDEWPLDLRVRQFPG